MGYNFFWYKSIVTSCSPESAVILEESTPSTLIRRQAQVNMKLQYFCTKKNYTSPPIRYVVYSPTHCIAYMIKFLFVAADPCDHTPVDLMKYVEMLDKLLLALVMKDT